MQNTLVRRKRGECIGQTYIPPLLLEMNLSSPSMSTLYSPFQVVVVGPCLGLANDFIFMHVLTMLDKNVLLEMVLYKLSIHGNTLF